MAPELDSQPAEDDGDAPGDVPCPDRGERSGAEGAWSRVSSTRGAESVSRRVSSPPGGIDLLFVNDEP